MEWDKDTALQRQADRLIKTLNLKHIDPGRIHLFRTRGSKARAYARIWAFPKIFQQVLNVEANYIIEVLSEKFDKLSDDNKTKVLIHELLHIPKNFSGALLPHKGRNRRLEKEVDKLFKSYKSK